MQGVSLGSTLVHLWDQTGRRDFRIDVVELKTILSEIEQRKRDYLKKRLGVPQRSLKIKYRGSQQNLERSLSTSLHELREQNRIRSHQLTSTMGVPWGNLQGDLYLEQRRDNTLDKEVTQPRHLSLQLQDNDLGPLGPTDWVLGDKDLFLSNLTINGRRYRGFGLFPAGQDFYELGHKPRKEKLRLSLFAGQEREGLFLDFPAGSQTRENRSNFAGSKLEYEWLEGFKTHLTGLQRFGPNSQFRADHVGEVGFDWSLSDWMDTRAIAARNGTESGLELYNELNPLDWLRLGNEFWRIGKRYKTVTGSVNRDGQTGWRGRGFITLPFWDEAILLRPEATIYRDLNALNPRNPDEWNSVYSIGTTIRFPLRTRLLANAAYEDQGGSLLPFLAQKYDATLSREFLFRENLWLQELLFNKEVIRSFTPFVGLRYADYEKSNNIPGFDATLKMFRVGTRVNFPKGVWGEVSWNQGVLKESNPESNPESIQPRELAVELGTSHHFQSPPVNLDMNFRYVDVEDTFRKSHQPFSDRNRLSATLRASWRISDDHELFGTVSATRERPETVRENTLLDFFAQVGMRLAWDTGWTFTRKSTITGSVFRDLNFNGKQDGVEPGVPGIRISVEGAAPAITDAGGRFQLRSIREGPRTVRMDPAQLPKGHFFTTPNSAEVLVLPGQKAEVFFGISTQVEFRGMAFNDLNENGVFDRTIDVPLQGIVFNLGTGQSSATDAMGHYRITKVSAGSHTISVVITSIPDGYRSLTPIRKEVTAQEGEVIPFDLPLKAQRTIYGIVFLDADANNRQENGEPGVPNVRVQINGLDSVTDEKGNYRFENVPPGTHELRLDSGTLPSGHKPRSPKPIRLDVPKEPFLLSQDFALVPADWKPEEIPAEEERPSAPEEKPQQERPADLKNRIRALLQELAPKESSIQIVDADSARRFPGLLALAELHPGIWIDRSESLEESAALIGKLMNRPAYPIHYYGSSERLRRFLQIAEAAKVEVQAHDTARLQILLRQILTNLSGKTEEEVSSQVDFNRLDFWLAEIAAEEK